MQLIYDIESEQN